MSAMDSTSSVSPADKGSVKVTANKTRGKQNTSVIYHVYVINQKRAVSVEHTPQNFYKRSFYSPLAIGDLTSNLCKNRTSSGTRMKNHGMCGKFGKVKYATKKCMF